MSSNLQNLLLNGNFEHWSAGTAVAPDAWIWDLDGAIAREDTTVKIGTYSCKLTRSGTNVGIYQEIHTEKGLAYWKGQTVTYSVWVKCGTASTASIQLYDGINFSPLTYHSGGGDWELLSTSLTIDGSANRVRAYCSTVTNDTSAYFDGAMLNEGLGIFAYTPHLQDFSRYQWRLKTPVLGKSMNTVYQAATDGFALLSGSSIKSEAATLREGSDSPPTNGAEAYVDKGIQDAAALPVGKGRYYKVTGGAGANPCYLDWIPFGV